MSEPIGYRITETLFSNEKTQVFRAIHEVDQCPVILRSLGAETSSQVHHTRLAFCAELLNKFDHPNIVKVLELIGDKTNPQLVLEDIQGIDFNAYVATLENRQIPTDTFLKLAIQLADALSLIHHAQVIHKDLHPGNIVINPESKQVQIIDFGLASLLSREQPTVATPERLEGILAYLSPEQTGRMNRGLDYRTDFYTLGICFYQWLTGILPFEASDALGMVYAHIAKVQSPAKSIRNGIPQNLSDIIDKLMSKNAEDRYQSALGLKYDLQQVLNALQTNEVNETEEVFTLGKKDTSDRFLIPQKLYGREKQVQHLMKSFYRASTGQCQLLAVTGASGLGKSALVNEVHKPIAAQQGCFISGKFEQFQQNSPYSAVKSAFEKWLDAVLTRPQTSLTLLADSICQTLGSNARVLIDFMPNFAILLGDLEPMPDLGAQEIQARFHWVCQAFIRLITQDQPMVLFIDDLQWADQGTLNLLPTLFDDSNLRLLVIVAYRDNEVDAQHPAILMLDKINSHEPNENNLEKYTHLSLPPLPLTDIQALLSDALHQALEVVRPLADLVAEKTAGNPFFTLEFLKSLYSEHLLNFELDSQSWVWDLSAIEGQSITDNVVELMLQKMQQLPKHTQKLMQLAACIGSRFDLDTLACISQQEATEVSYALWAALQEGLIIQQSTQPPLGVVLNTEDQIGCSKRIASQATQTQLLPVSSPYKFLHDRMRQAAYESLSESECQQTHLSIARLLLKAKVFSAKVSEAKVYGKQVHNDFMIVDHFNKALDLLENEDEKHQVAHLNQQAAEQALHSSVWSAAADYARIGMELLPPQPWKNNSDLCRLLYRSRAESEYLSGQPEITEKLYEELLAHTTDKLDKAEICAQRIVHHIGLAEYEKGLDVGFKGLAYLELHIPREESNLTSFLSTQQAHLTAAFAQTPIEKISTLPEMQDRVSQLSMVILANIGISAMILTQRTLFTACTYESLLLTIKHGKCDLTANSLAIFGQILNIQEMYEQAYVAGQQALVIKAQYPYCRESSSLLNSIGLGSQHLKEPTKKCIATYQQGYEEGLRSGELARAGVCLAAIPLIKFIDGSSIKALLTSANNGLSFGQKMKLRLYAAKILQHYAQSMLLHTDKLTPEDFSAQDYTLINSSFFRSILHQCQFHYSFWSQQSLAGLLDKAKDVLDSYLSLKQAHFTSDSYFLISLSILWAQKNGDFANDKAEDWLEHYQSFYNKLMDLKTCYPPNHQHKLALLKAEQMQQAGEPMEAIAESYQFAIRTASENGFYQYAALANELYADYLIDKGFSELADKLIHQAYRLYQDWDCQPKIDNLPKKYACLRKPEGQVSSSVQSISSTTMGTSTLQANKELDYDSIIKSAQGISGQLELAGLIKQVLESILENAGAQYAALVFQNPEGDFVEALVDLEQPNFEQTSLELEEQSRYLQHQPLAECQDLPIGMLELSLRKDQRIQLTDASQQGEFINDVYIQRKQTKSVLCLPMRYRDHTIGALYLENNLSSNAFTEQNLDTLNMLLVQAAISFENARLFHEISELNVGLEEKVKQRTVELEQVVQELDTSNKDLEVVNKELEAFSYSVSHDLRSPLRTIKGYGEILLEDHADNLDPEATFLLKKIVTGGKKMSELIRGLLDLSHVQQQEVVRQNVSLSKMAEGIIQELREQDAERQVDVSIESGLEVEGDKRMLYSLLENLLNNAWKYSSKTAEAKISLSSLVDKNKTVYLVKDNGAGFDMAHINILFVTFQRLHSEKEFKGTGVGLGTVKRIIEKHGGRIWAEAEKDKGATFYFTLN